MRISTWLRKSLFILISILTFGLVTPSEHLWQVDAGSSKQPKKNDIADGGQQQIFDLHDDMYNHSLGDRFERGEFISALMEGAEMNAYAKFGDRIGPRIGSEFNEVILPKIEEAINEITAQFPEKDLEHLAISEKPASGRGEKIFHIYDEHTGMDIIRFHVRLERPPQDGYWFNFHYHTYRDRFASHYELGRIYWDKNTPPLWSKTSHLS
ncbi:hypothetical protein D0469_09015 [Peribacillus saganii]|uniref:YpjP-like protein n=1 Tax=Peribacillus saganii TaxID=2303992 RepID=A0A372LQC8_9BACI|nr:YpjP family protein [Peribacillus saganii]RFU69708.1 hypothetical protein D0469_09015 [Peribacillus saganii]